MAFADYRLWISMKRTCKLFYGFARNEVLFPDYEGWVFHQHYQVMRVPVVCGRAGVCP